MTTRVRLRLLLRSSTCALSKDTTGSRLPFQSIVPRYQLGLSAWRSCQRPQRQ